MSEAGVARQTAYRLAADVVAKGAFFLLTILAARRLSREAFGQFAVATTVGWLSGVVTDAGLQMHVARSVASTSLAGARRALDRWLPWRVCAAALALGAAIAWVLVTSAQAHVGAAIVLLVAAGLAGAITEFYGHLFRGLSRPDLESMLTLGSRLVALAAGSAVLMVEPTVLALACTLLGVNAATTLVAARTAAHIAPSVPSDGTASLGPRWQEFTREALPIGVGVALSALYFRVDVLLLERWDGPEVAGGYNAVFRLVEALRLIPGAAIAVALPTLFRAHTFHEAGRLATALTAGATVLSAVLWLSADRLIPFCFGPTFASTVPAYRILLAAFPLMTLNYVLTTQLISWHRHRAFAALCGVALVFNLALNRLLIPAWSLDGSAWTTLWTEVVLTLGCGAVLASIRPRHETPIGVVVSP